jgi:glycosyltransferase involved in cell wall biosynthesis
VEVVVIDNASPDETPELMKDYVARHASLRSFRNDRNLGYAGNQAKCIDYARGQYIAILCDDDVYLQDAVAGILAVVQRREYAFIALNYSAFTRTPEKPRVTHVGPPEDREFTRAYDVMKHPSVGHYSGFVYNAALAKQALAVFLERHVLSDFEVYRGIQTEICVRALIPTALPSYYIGRPLVGARQPLVVDYDSLQHLCLDYYRWALRLHTEGLLTDADLAFSRNAVLSWLPKALYRNAGYFNDIRLRQLRQQLDTWFGNEPVYQRRIVPLLRRLEHPGLRCGLRLICNLYRGIKTLWWKVRR